MWLGLVLGLGLGLVLGLGLDYGLVFSSDIRLRHDPQLLVSHLATTLSQWVNGDDHEGDVAAVPFSIAIIG